jgi:hypothetical protein
MSCCTRTGSLNLHMKRTSIVIIIINKGCILGSSHKLMKIWSKGWRLVIIGFLFILRGSLQALIPNNVKKL